MIEARDFVPRTEVAVEFEALDRFDPFGDAGTASQRQQKNEAKFTAHP
jgi:hypothetical protein